jgi:hypothetical protein
MPGADRRVRGDVALVGGGGDTWEVAQDAITLRFFLLLVRFPPSCGAAGVP